MFKKLFSVVILIIIMVIAFWNVNNIFFQQDEWLGLGNAFSFRAGGGIRQIMQEVFWPNHSVSRILPLTGLTNYVVFNTFKLNPWAYGLLAVSVASVNAILLYLILQKWLESHILGVMVASLWITNNLALQSITWIGTFIPSQFSVLFLLLAWYSWQRQRLWLTVALMWASLWYKEMAPFYIILFPILAWLQKKLTVKTLIILTLPLVIMLGLPKLINLTRNLPIVVSPSLVPVTNENVFYNMWLLPARTLAHIFLPTNSLYKIFYRVDAIHYGIIGNGQIVESVVGDAFSLLVSFYILLAIFSLTALGKGPHSEAVWISLMVLFISILPYALFNNQNAILEPRYYIYPALAAYLAIVVSVYRVFKASPKYIGSLILVLIFSPLLRQNILGVQANLSWDIQTGQYRRQILKTVDSVRNNLGKNNIFLFSAPQGGFYEFQSGFGQTLAVWFYDTGKIPVEVLRDRDFWELGYEGIKNYSGRKYGYFMNYDKLLSVVKNDVELNPNQIIAFMWNSQNHTVKNNTQEVREKLKRDLR